jgi:hypothetical protein
MWIKRSYVAEDGTEFSNEQDCQEYEDNLRNKGYQCLEDYIHFYNRVGNLIPYSKLRNNLVYYAKVDFIPNWNDDQVVQAWEDVVPEELADRIDCCGTGWYISDGDDNWDSWESYSEEYSNRNSIINKIVCEGR